MWALRWFALVVLSSSVSLRKNGPVEAVEIQLANGNKEELLPLPLPLPSYISLKGRSKWEMTQEHHIAKNSPDDVLFGRVPLPEEGTAKDIVQVLVELKGESVAHRRHLLEEEEQEEVEEELSVKRRRRALRQAHKRQLVGQQNDMVEQLVQIAPSLKVVAQVQVVLNAVMVQVERGELRAILESDHVDVLRIQSASHDYQLYLDETVDHIGASDVYTAPLSLTGKGIRVAVLDSGVDYTHANLGGPGTQASYVTAATNNVKNNPFYPTSKVVGGVDFISNDANPMDDTRELGGGHGTHVADIIGGVNGVAPGVELYAIRVCGGKDRLCSPRALLQGLEFVADPNGDGDFEDAMDVLNLSLGSPYGTPFDDTTSTILDTLSQTMGVVCVAAVGNLGNRPYATGTPAGAISAIAVAQTSMPSESLPIIQVEGQSQFPSKFQQWSIVPTTTHSGKIQYGDGKGNNLDACRTFEPNELTGLILLVDRGTCPLAQKVKNIGDAGGIAALLGLVDDSRLFSRQESTWSVSIPAYMIQQDHSEATKAILASNSEARCTIDPAESIHFISPTSSRGPGHEEAASIKPELGAPGQSKSAISGSGTTTGSFSGTSGSSPMVAGAVALLLESNPNLTPAEVKARLMNTASRYIWMNDGSELAPISLMGSGELRIDVAVTTPLAAWDKETQQAGLSFGFLDVSEELKEITKTIVVKNYDTNPVSLELSSEIRAVTSAVEMVLPPTLIRVDGKSTFEFDVVLRIHGDRLKGNFMNSGEGATDSSTLDENEYDGHIVLNGSGYEIHLPWHVLPRKAAKIVTPIDSLIFDEDGNVSVELINEGVGIVQMRAFSLIQLSKDKPEGGRGDGQPTPDLRAMGVTTYPVEAGYCSDNESFVWAFAITTWERQQLLLSVGVEILFDIDRDGELDYILYINGNDASRRVYTQNVATGETFVQWWVEHATNTANTVLYVCAESIGLSRSDLESTPVDVSFLVRDEIYSGPGDRVDWLTVTPGGERYRASNMVIPGIVELRLQREMMQKWNRNEKRRTRLGMARTMNPRQLPIQNDSYPLVVRDFGALPENSQELGLLLITNSDRGIGNRGGATPDTEAIIVLL